MHGACCYCCIWRHAHSSTPPLHAPHHPTPHHPTPHHPPPHHSTRHNQAVANAHGALGPRDASASAGTIPTASAAAALVSAATRDGALCDGLLSALVLEAGGRALAPGSAAVAPAGGGRDPAATAVALCELSVVCGRGISDALLQRVQGLLRDPSGMWLLGHESLPQLLGRLEPCRIATAVEGACKGNHGPGPDAGSAAVQQHTPFALEQGLGSICLLLLVRSPVQRQRETAASLVQQLARLSEALRRAPLPWEQQQQQQQQHVRQREQRGGGAGAGAGAGSLSDGGEVGGGVASPPLAAPLPGPGSPQPPLPPPQQQQQQQPNDRRTSAASDGSAGGGAQQFANEGAAAAAAGGNGGGGGGGSGRQRRFGGRFGSATRARQAAATAATGLVGGGPAAGPPAYAAHDATSDAALGVGSAALLQVSVWQRLVVLLPLLPTVRADRGGELRSTLAGALAALLASPHLRPGALQLEREGTATPADTAAAAAAAAHAAAHRAGRPLLAQLQHVLSAVLSGSWAGWLRGNNKRLREVPEYPNAAQLWAVLDALPRDRLPDQLRARVRAALPLPPEPALLMLPEASGVVGRGASDNAAGAAQHRGGTGAGGGDEQQQRAAVPRCWDPWVPLQQPPAAAAPAPAPAVALLAACVKRRGGALAYAGGGDDDDYGYL